MSTLGTWTRRLSAVLIALATFLVVPLTAGAGADTAHAASVARGATAATSATTAPAQAAPVKVMPLGDSITDGFTVPGAYRTDLWQKLVQDGYDVDFVGSLAGGPSELGDQDHEGHSGWTIAQIASNIDGWLSTYTPDTILLHIGTNDIYGEDPQGAPERLSALVDRITAQTPDTELFVATIIPVSFADETVRAFNEAVVDIVTSKAETGARVHLVDMYSQLTTADLVDGVHPNATGYSKMADAWYEALLSVPGSIGDATTTRTGASDVARHTR